MKGQSTGTISNKRQHGIQRRGEKGEQNCMIQGSAALLDFILISGSFGLFLIFFILIWCYITAEKVLYSICKW